MNNCVLHFSERRPGSLAGTMCNVHGTSEINRFGGGRLRSMPPCYNLKLSTSSKINSRNQYIPQYIWKKGTFSDVLPREQLKEGAEKSTGFLQVSSRQKSTCFSATCFLIIHRSLPTLRTRQGWPGWEKCSHTGGLTG